MLPHFHRNRFVILAPAIAAFITSATFAETPAAATDSGWEVTGAAGLSLADGNADSLSYRLQMLASRLTAEDELYLNADYFYADNRGIETTNALRLGAQYNRLLSDQFYYGFSGSYLTDQVADINYRIDLNALLGYYLIKDEKTTLALEAGPGYTWEEQNRIKSDYLNLRFGEKFTYQLSPGAKLWQSVYFTPEAADFDNYLLTAEAGIDVLLTKQWSLRSFIRHQHDSTPAIGREPNDTSIMLGLAYSLAGFPEPPAAGRRTLKPERKPAEVAPMGWVTSASLGYGLASGNSDNSSLTVMFDSAHRASDHEFFLNGAANYGENNGNTSISNARANVQYNRNLQAPFYVGAGLGFQHDDVADLKYRFTPAFVGGAYLIKTDRTSLSVEAGPGYTFEKVGNLSTDFFSIQAAEKFSYAFTSRCTFNQTLVYNAEAADLSENFTLIASAYLDTDLTDHLALRIAGTYTYDNTPAPNREHHDTTLTSGIAVKF